MNEYPKMLYRSGWSDLDDCVIVHDMEQEGVANDGGFVPLGPIDAEKEQEDEAPKPRRGRPKKDAQ